MLSMKINQGQTSEAGSAYRGGAYSKKAKK